MMRRVAREAQIFGINFWIVSAAVGAATIAFSLLAGELLDFYPAIFEVVYPFFAAIVVGEWGKTRSDGNFDLIAAQCESLFPWVLRRYTAAFGGASLFAVLSMAGASIARYELPLGELLAMYFPPAFFLSSLCALLGFLCKQEHIATLVCGIVWLVLLFTRSLLRFPGLEYIYLLSLIHI